MFSIIQDFNTGYIIAYFVLGLLALFSLCNSNVKRPFLTALFIAVIYATIDEFQQAFVPVRDAVMADLMKNIVTACIALLSVYARQLWKNKVLLTRQNNIL
ncbi:MAG: VanZ family protein [Clostridiales bacterium]|nr:VanZ family protein [Clostridiales bacterium]MCF8022769.1 VanZ family protein [Clostridiales bacterium]